MIEHNTVHDNGQIGIEIQAGAVNTNVKNNTLYANGIEVVDRGTATILSP